MKISFVVAVIVACVLVTGCGKSLSGKYESQADGMVPAGAMSIEFKDGKAHVSAMGSPSMAVDYEIKGDAVHMKSPQKGDNEDLVLKIKGDELIGEGPINIVLKKK